MAVRCPPLERLDQSCRATQRWRCQPRPSRTGGVFTTMHELSIAMSIVELAGEEAEERGGCTIQAVHLKLGPLAGVVKRALLASYEMACEGTVLENSRLIIEET